MAAVSPIKQKSGLFQGPASCSVCLEPVSDAGERSIAKLKCGHHFHLDCIGSAFNAKGTMQCPNCRRVEDGQWLYANGCRQRDDSMVEDIINDDDYDVYAGVSELFFPHDLMHFGHLQWCPYQSSYTQFSVSLGEMEHPPAAYADLVVNVLVGEHAGSLDSSRACPFLQAQGPRLSRHLPVPEENVAVLDIPMGPHHGGTVVADAAAGQVFSPPNGGRWAQRTPTPLTAPSGMGSVENGLLGGMHLHDRPRWPRSDADSSQATGNYFPLYFGDSGVNQRPGDVATNTMGTHNMLPRAQNHNLHAQGGTSQLAPHFTHFSGPGTHSRRGRVPASTQVSGGRPAHYPPEGPVMHGPPNWGFVGTSAVHDSAVGGVEAGHRDGAAFTQWRREGSSTVPQYPPEPEVQRWAPPPLSGIYHMHDIYGSDPPAQAGFRNPEGHFGNQFQGLPFRAFSSTFMPDSQADTGSLQPPTSNIH